MNSLEMLMNKSDEDKVNAERRLKELCSKTTRFDYEYLIKRLMDITENKLHENDYRFVSFMGWLADGLEQSYNEKRNAWDISILDIVSDYSDSEDKSFQDEDFAELCSYSLDGTFGALLTNYNYRKELGLID